MTQRRLKNWLTSFNEWTAPRSESPDSILDWCGYFTIASVARRHVQVTKEYLGSWNCYPSIFVLFVGPQGMIKKSTTIGFAEDLLDEVKEACELEASPDGVTIADLLQRMQNASESSLYILSSEFSTLVLKAGLGIYDILTDLYDGKKKIDEGTIGRGYIFASSPCLNFLGATTPKWIGANMTESIIGGGFGSRIIPIFEDQPRQRILYYKKRISWPKMDKLREDLIHDLKHINTIKGNFEIPDDAYAFMEEWYLHNSEAPPGTDSKITGFYQRQPAHIHKIAMIIHLSRSDDLILTIEDFMDAIEALNKIQPKIAGTYKAIGNNAYAIDMVSIVKYIEQKGRVSHPELLRTFHSAAEPHKLDEILTGLLQMQTISLKTDNKVVYYEYVMDLDGSNPNEH